MSDGDGVRNPSLNLFLEKVLFIAKLKKNNTIFDFFS